MGRMAACLMQPYAAHQVVRPDPVRRAQQREDAAQKRERDEMQKEDLRRPLGPNRTEGCGIMHGAASRQVLCSRSNVRWKSCSMRRGSSKQLIHSIQVKEEKQLTACGWRFRTGRFDGGVLLMCLACSGPECSPL